MERFCEVLHPTLGVTESCVTWFQQATEHCTAVIMRTRSSSELWSTVRELIFPLEQTGILQNQNTPIGINPKALSLRDCHGLFVDIVGDYLRHAPNYATETATNAMLWQMIYLLIGLIAFGSLFLNTIYWRRKFCRKAGRSGTDDVFGPEQRARAYVRRNMRIVQHELRRLRVQHVVQPADLFASDGTAALVLRLSTKLNFLDQIVTCQEQAMARLYRLHELMGKKNAIKPDFKAETMTKALKFLSKYPRKLHVIFVFDDEPIYEKHAHKRKIRSPPARLSPRQVSLPALTALLPGQQIRKVGSASSCTSTARNTQRSMSPLSMSSTPRLQTIPRTFSRRNSCINFKK